MVGCVILLVEDDFGLAFLIKKYLELHGMVVIHESRGDMVLNQIQEEKPDLIILDLSLPGKDGLDICREVHLGFFIPVLILTARDSDTDQILGLELGADDYVTKPVEPKVLHARIRALLRRYLVKETVKFHAPKKNNDENLCFGLLFINNSSRTVKFDNKDILLSTADYDLLWVLASEAGKIITREKIFSTIHGFESDGFGRSIDVRISRLRKKLFDHPINPYRIKTIWGKGYLFVKDAWNVSV
ncbi:MAG: response regulator [Desulfobacteraceae bacterium]|nr:response regulator [Desulfobacteraceae bacterium]